jgi:hypothetical protein
VADRARRLDAAERATVEAFAVAERRARFSALADKREGRRKLKESILGDGVRSFDERWMERLKPGQFPDAIYEDLRARGAPTVCRVLAFNELDGHEVPLLTALERVVGSRIEALLICIPGKLAFLETEYQDERYVLQRR